MSVEPFRFIHATGVQLDQPLTGAGTLTGEDRQIAEDAPLTAFARIVEHCIEQEAAFLLLTGNTFDFTDQYVPLPARVALEGGLSRLAEHDIRAFIVPGVTDAPAAWKRVFRLPENVTTFFRDDDGPASVVRNGRTLCSVFPVATPHVDEARWPALGAALLRRASDAPFRIGLVGAGSDVGWEDDDNWRNPDSTLGKVVRSATQGGVNYLAMGHGMQRRSREIASGVAHDPGSPQARISSETGSHGCTLVSVESGGRIETRLLPTATVRWESPSVDVEPSMNWNDLVERMQLTVLEADAHPGEELWLIRWTLRGEGELYDALAEAAAREELWELVENELRTSGVRRSHLLSRVPRAIERPDDDPVFGLRGEFLENINADLSESVARFQRSMRDLDWPDTEWSREIVRALDRLRPSAVGRHAREMAGDLFS